eukprot:TRINITY_DN1890_c0_g1_i1.p1 TRINITY_DN1890_c0_g1~~TRINITY_DN1890_c0_g1_i1.p1  ORF type:complete len:194 (-),score=45.90 TRINITY_DN1890_c0_g1_i1:45-626(-)
MFQYDIYNSLSNSLISNLLPQTHSQNSTKQIIMMEWIETNKEKAIAIGAIAAVGLVAVGGFLAYRSTTSVTESEQATLKNPSPQVTQIDEETEGAFVMATAEDKASLREIAFDRFMESMQSETEESGMVAQEAILNYLDVLTDVELQTLCDKVFSGPSMDTPGLSDEQKFEGVCVMVLTQLIQQMQMQGQMPK